jgi:hypothetical protein
MKPCEVKGDNKGIYREHKLEYTGMKVNIVVYALNERRKFNTYFKKDFTLMEKPDKPISKSDKIYF